MKTRNHDEAETNAGAILARVRWTGAMPALLRSARHYLRALGWAEGDAYRPAVLEERELVNATYDLLRTGRRRLPPELCETEAGVLRVFSKTMFSVAMTRARRVELAEPAGGDQDLEAQADDRPTASRRFHACSLIERLESLFQGDAEALAILGGLTEGNLMRDDIREHLGWTADHLKVVLRRMSRRAESAHLIEDDGGEAGPESSGPHRRYDEPTDAGGRHGSPPEHDRRARAAARRR